MARGRPAKVFVRRLKPKEGRAIQRMVRRGRKDGSPVAWRRALVVLMSAQRRTPREIADAIDAKEGWVRQTIHCFDEAGIDALHPKWRGGRPRTITDDMRADIVEVYRSPARRRTVHALVAFQARRPSRPHQVVPSISKERLREILIEEGFSIQRTKTWKWSPDPDYEAKRRRLERLYERAVKGTLDGVVVPFDEHGPVQPIPKRGRAWAENERPKRIPANYRKPHGVRFFLGAYDVGKDQLTGYASFWVPTTWEKTSSRGGGRRTRARPTCSLSSNGSGDAILPRCASTWSWTTSPRTGPRTSGHGPSPTTSCSWRPRRTRRGSTRSSLSSGSWSTPCVLGFQLPGSQPDRAGPERLPETKKRRGTAQPHRSPGREDQTATATPPGADDEGQAGPGRVVAPSSGGCSLLLSHGNPRARPPGGNQAPQPALGRALA